LFENKLAANIKSNKVFYAYAQSKSKAKVQVSTVLNKHGQNLSNKKDIVQSFNTYFASVFPKRTPIIFLNNNNNNDRLTAFDPGQPG